MNNWLGFSLSPQELPAQTHENHHHHAQNGVVSSQLGFNSDEISGAGGDVSGEYHLPPPFGILEAFHRHPHAPSHQDWDMKGMEGNYKGSTEISMLMGGDGSCNTHTIENGHVPKLENFLDAPSYDHHHHHSNGHGYMFINGSSSHDHHHHHVTNPRSTSNISSATNGNGINVSMIKTWLRNQPIQPEGEGGGGAGGGGGLTSVQALSLSMSTGSEVGSALPLLVSGGDGGGGEVEGLSKNGKQQGETGACTAVDAPSGALEVAPRKSVDTFGQRTSIYRGVTRHRWTGRYEAHLWDNSCRREGQTRKGRQVYLGGYDKEEKAARAYDLAAIKYWGTTTTSNFPISEYEKEIEEMKHMTRQEYVASLRRKSSGFSRGASIYRGVTRHHQHGRWQARIGRVAGNKDLYLGTFSTQEEAAEAYDIAAIKFRGLNAVTNFEISRYDVKAILESTTLPIGGAAKRLKDVEELASDHRQRCDDNHHPPVPQLIDGIGPYHNGWPTIAFPGQTIYPYAPQRVWCKQEQDSENSTVTHHHQQFQLSNTHNFFQMHNLMNLDNSSVEHSSGSHSVVYPSMNGSGDGGYGSTGFGFSTGAVVSHGGTEDEPIGYENLYYHSQLGNNIGVKATNTQDQSSGCNGWVPTAIPALGSRAHNMAVCHSGTPTFTVWNDT